MATDTLSGAIHHPGLNFFSDTVNLPVTCGSISLARGERMAMDKTVPPGAAKLLDFIGHYEAPRGYDTVYGNRAMPQPLTSMTVDEVIADGSRRTREYGSSACGRYQFMAATLRDLKNELGLRGSQVFDPDLQDRLGYHLLRRRGYDKYVEAKMGMPEFGRGLAQEWASLPVLAEMRGAHRTVKRGESYYAGDKLNKALVKPEAVEAVLRDVLSKDAASIEKVTIAALQRDIAALSKTVADLTIQVAKLSKEQA